MKYTIKNIGTKDNATSAHEIGEENKQKIKGL